MADHTSNANQRLIAVILAAGKGTRMQSDLPKVVHHVGGRPMVCAVTDACFDAGCVRVVAVVGYKQELVREALASDDRVDFAVQEEQNGTGHAVRCALPAVEDLDDETDVLVLCGDGPLIRSETLVELLGAHRDSNAAMSLATSIIEDPTGYGRIVRDADGGFERIVEQKNATPEEAAINEVNPSYYCFTLGALRRALSRITTDAVGGEEYITDAPRILKDAGETVSVVAAVPPEDILSINTPDQLAEVDRIYRGRTTAAGTGGQG